jgi:hypothetical protein
MTCLGCLFVLHGVYTIHLAALLGPLICLFLRRRCSVRGLRAPCLRRCSVRALRSPQLVGWRGGFRGFAAREMDGDIFSVSPRPHGTWCKFTGFPHHEREHNNGVSFRFPFLFQVIPNAWALKHWLLFFASKRSSKQRFNTLRRTV